MVMSLKLSRSRIRMSLRRKIAKAKGTKKVRAAIAGGMNANEERFDSLILLGQGAYEATKITITKRKARKYTPDFIYTSPSGIRAVIEVKGAYRLHSEDRARLAWEIAAEMPGDDVYVWARFKRQAYECEAWLAGGERVIKRRLTTRDEFNALLEEVKGIKK